MDKQIESLIGNYRITANIGQGAYSEVYLAQHIVFTNRIVAIKILVPVFAEVQKEMKRALERHEAGDARVIPIILRPTHLEVTPFGKLQALPTEAKPVTLWSDRDEAFLDVVRGIQKVVDKLTKPSI